MKRNWFCHLIKQSTPVILNPRICICYFPNSHYYNILNINLAHKYIFKGITMYNITGRGTFSSFYLKLRWARDILVVRPNKKQLPDQKMTVSFLDVTNSNKLRNQLFVNMLAFENGILQTLFVVIKIENILIKTQKLPVLHTHLSGELRDKGCMINKHCCQAQIETSS